MPVYNCKETFLGKVNTHGLDPDLCWEWLGADKGNGYGHTSRGTAHRVAYKLFVGPVPDDKDVCHHCDNRICVNPEHLFIGSRLENMRDCLRKGRIARGNKLPDRRGENGPAKLTWDQVREIRLSDERTLILANKYGVTTDNIRVIRRGETWKEENVGIS